ncbi:hypothetical protein BD770DRAFT_405137 [Pilaira anomala]|nr:hypothetical protein BD770DRAFT_405137 [Pilaira anomala]
MISPITASDIMDAMVSMKQDIATIKEQLLLMTYTHRMPIQVKVSQRADRNSSISRRIMESPKQAQALIEFHEKVRTMARFYTNEKMEELYANPNLLGARAYTQVNTNGTHKANLMQMLRVHLQGNGTTSFARKDEEGKVEEMEEMYSNFLFVTKPVVRYLVLNGDSEQPVGWGHMFIKERVKFALAVERIFFFYENGGIPCDIGDVPTEDVRTEKFIPLHLALESWRAKAFIAETIKNLRPRSFESSSSSGSASSDTSPAASIAFTAAATSSDTSSPTTVATSPTTTSSPAATTSLAPSSDPHVFSVPFPVFPRRLVQPDIDEEDEFSIPGFEESVYSRLRKQLISGITDNNTTRETRPGNPELPIRKRGRPRKATNEGNSSNRPRLD